MLWPKINSYREFDNEKKFLRLENSPPPPPTLLNFSNGASLNDKYRGNLSRGTNSLLPFEVNVMLTSLFTCVPTEKLRDSGNHVHP